MRSDTPGAQKFKGEIIVVIAVPGIVSVWSFALAKVKSRAQQKLEDSQPTDVPPFAYSRAAF